MKIILSLMVLLSSVAFAKGPAKICLAGSTVKVFPKYGDAFTKGAELAIKQSELKEKVVIENHFYDRAPMAALKAYKNMRRAGCSAIIGFSNMNDLLMIRREAKKDKILVLSIYGELNQKLREVEHIKTMQPSAQELAAQLIKHVEKNKFKMKKALIAVAVDRNSFQDYREYFETYFKSKGIKYNLINFIERNFDEEKVKKELTHLKMDHDTLILLSRAMASAKIADLVTKQNPNVLILGTKNFGSSSLPAFLQRLKNKNVKGFFARHNTLLDPDKKYQHFVSSYKKEYGMGPMVISGHTFDAVKIVLKAMNESKMFDAANVQSAARKLNYSGITGVQLKSGLDFHFKKHFILEITKSGYQLEGGSAL